ncbi:hypothetical protein PWT90_01121 [Aphanocladium album]|nr:hypothetical protein PWT90_01121 [Aphanocladium album]
MAEIVTELREGYLHNTAEYVVRTDSGEFLVQLAWPLAWTEDRKRPENEDKPVSTFYLVDGGVFFFTAVEIARRLEFTSNVRTVVVGIGYPKAKCVYDWRRGPDLTPPTPNGEYVMPLGRDGKPRTDLTFGEANTFLDFVQSHVMAQVEEKFFPDVPLRTSRKALYGHSYGGIFTLHVLFTKPKLFDFFVAASPTIWWSDDALVKNQEAEFHRHQDPIAPPRSLLITWGLCENELEKKEGETEDAFISRKAIAESENMAASVKSLVARLQGHPAVGNIWTCHLPGEDHGSAAVVGLQRGLMKFLLDSN